MASSGKNATDENGTGKNGTGKTDTGKNGTGKNGTGKNGTSKTATRNKHTNYQIGMEWHIFNIRVWGGKLEIYDKGFILWCGT